MKETILVTGGCGFIGAHVCLRLANDGYKVVCYDIVPARKGSEIEYLHSLCGDNLEFVQGDTLLFNKMLKVIQKHEIKKVFHAGGTTNVDFILNDPYNAFKVNFDSTLNLLEMTRLSSLNKIVFSSSITAYSPKKYEPIDEEHPTVTSDGIPAIFSYSSSKVAAESMGMTYWGLFKTDFIAHRYSGVYGFGMNYPMYIKPMVENSLKNLPTRFETGQDMKRDYTFIDDVVQGVVNTLFMDTTTMAKRIFNVTSAMDLVNGKRLVEVVTKLIPGAEVKVGPGMTKNEENDLKIRGLLSNENSKKYLNYQPKHNIEEGTFKYIEDYKKYMDWLQKQ